MGAAAQHLHLSTPHRTRAMIPPSEDSALPLFEPDPEATYTLEVVAELCGISTQTVLHYQEQGLLPRTPRPASYTDEALRALRRIEDLRTHYEMNLEGIKLMLQLMDDLERLQRDLRSRR